MVFLLSHISPGLQENITYRGRCLLTILDLVAYVSMLL